MNAVHFEGWQHGRGWGRGVWCARKGGGGRYVAIVRRGVQKHAVVRDCRLYVEKVEMGEEEPRTIISGLVEYQPIEQMEVHHLAASYIGPSYMDSTFLVIIQCNRRALHNFVSYKPGQGAQHGCRSIG